MNYHSVSWKQLHDLTNQLADKIAADNHKIDLIVGIARGGLTISHIVSDFLQLSVASFTISSYKDLVQQELSEITYHVGANLSGKHILLIDDISDTGKTFTRGIHYLKELGAEQVTTASPFIRVGSTYLPNYHILEMKDEWVVFPYDIRDTVEDVGGFMKKEGKTKVEIEKKLSELDIQQKQIDRYLK